MRFLQGNYKERFIDEVNIISATAPSYTIEERKSIINDLIEEYIEDTGKRPDSRQIDRLSSALLYEFLQGDTRPNKAKLESAPILTFSQVKHRQNREVTGDMLEYIGGDRKTHFVNHNRRRTKGEQD